MRSVWQGRRAFCVTKRSCLQASPERRQALAPTGPYQRTPTTNKNLLLGSQEQKIDRRAEIGMQRTHTHARDSKVGMT